MLLFLDGKTKLVAGLQNFLKIQVSSFYCYDMTTSTNGYQHGWQDLQLWAHIEHLSSINVSSPELGDTSQLGFSEQQALCKKVRLHRVGCLKPQAEFSRA